MSLLVLSTAFAAFAGPASAAATGWTVPHQLADHTTNYEGPLGASVAVGVGGRTLAAWDNYDDASSYFQVFYQWYTPESGWGEGGVLYDYWGDDVESPNVAASANGDFFLVAEDHGSFLSPFIAAYHFDATQRRWESVGQPNTDVNATAVTGPQVAMDSAGNAVVVWRTQDSSEFNISANRYTKGDGWGAGETPLDARATSTQNPRVVMDAAGTATAAWQQSDGSHVRMYASSQSSSGGWSTPQVLDGQIYDAYNPRLAVSSGGDVIATYLQNNGSNSNIYAAMKPRGSSWMSPDQVSTYADFAAGNERAAGGPNSDFVVAWNQFNGSEYKMMASVLHAGNWTAPQNFSDQIENTGGGSVAWAGMDASGNALVMWDQYSPGHPTQLWSVWWTPSGGWGQPALVVAAGSNADLYALDLGASGHAVAVWTQYDGYGTQLWAAAYAAPDLTAPDINAHIVGGDPASNSTLFVEGTGSTDDQITVNGVPAYWTGGPNWRAVIPLHPGNNEISVEARDAAGNAALLMLNVTYNDPVPGLDAQIAQLHADVAAANAANQATQHNLETTQHALETTQSTLTTSQNDLSQLRLSEANANANQTGATASAAAAAGSASLMGLLGMIVGLAGVGIALVSMRKPKGGVPEQRPPPSTPAPPPATPPTPAEPPK